MYKIEEIIKCCEKVGFDKRMIWKLINALPKKRTAQENKALHVLFLNISTQLNDMGRSFNYEGLKGLKMDMKYSPYIVKEFTWKPIQIALTEKQSTTELTNADIQEIFEVLGKWFADNGVYIEFPSA